MEPFLTPTRRSPAPARDPAPPTHATPRRAVRDTGDMEIDVKSFQNVLTVAVLMGLIGVALSLGGLEDATAAAAARAGAKGKATKTGATPKKKATK